MKYSFKDFPALLRTPLGRRKLVAGLEYRAFPLFAALARVYRKYLINNTCLVAVVGSFGKTTTTRVTTAALGMNPDHGSGNNQFTPLAKMILSIPSRAQYQVVEAGISGPGQMESYARFMLPNVVVVTTIGSEHRRSLKDDETTRHEKAYMVRSLPPDGTAVLNGDDDNVMWMKTQTSARALTFGLREGNDVRATAIRTEWPGGTRFRLHAGKETRDVNIRLIGKPMVYSALGGMAAAWAAGRDLDAIVCEVEKLAPTPGRLAPVPLASGAWLLEDTYKSPLETIHAALDTMETCKAKRKLIVIGEVSEPPGSQGPIYRELGQRLAIIADRVYVLGVNFRRYRAGARAGGLPSEHFINAGRDMNKVVHEVEKTARSGDVILIKGRDTQRLDRIALRLCGRKVACDIPVCESRMMCYKCPMVERGWGSARVVM